MCGPWRLSQRAVCLSAQLCLAYFATSVCSGTATTKHFIYLYLKNLTWILSLSKLKKVKHQDALFLDDVMLVLLGIQLIIMQKSLLIRNISFSVLISHTPVCILSSSYVTSVTFLLPGWQLISCLVVGNTDLGYEQEELHKTQLCSSCYWELPGHCYKDWDQSLMDFTDSWGTWLYSQ